jgi:hypothetical protein
MRTYPVPWLTALGSLVIVACSSSAPPATPIAPMFANETATAAPEEGQNARNQGTLNAEYLLDMLTRTTPAACGAHRHSDDVRDDAVPEMLVTESDAFIDTGETA